MERKDSTAVYLEKRFSECPWLLRTREVRSGTDIDAGAARRKEMLSSIERVYSWMKLAF